jgi:hypothetical protein
MVAHQPAQRELLVSALTACAETGVRSRARRFLLGLSADELQFIAEFVGSCILETPSDFSRASEHAERYQRRVLADPRISTDRENKLILLREYLNYSGRRLSCCGRSGTAMA